MMTLITFITQREQTNNFVPRGGWSGWVGGQSHGGVRWAAGNPPPAPGLLQPKKHVMFCSRSVSRGMSAGVAQSPIGKEGTTIHRCDNVLFLLTFF
jgi:hypothetical protein